MKKINNLINYYNARSDYDLRSIKNNGGVYAHGRLETLLGYDVLLSQTPFVEGINTIVVNTMVDGHNVEHIATLFSWVDVYNLKHGIACFDYDLTAVKYAVNHYYKKSLII